MPELEDLLAPISDALPCGEDMSFSTEFDRIQEARRNDDPTLEQGEWITDLKSADWPAVLEQSSRLLQQRSKDLQLAVWFTEAAAQTQGFRGLALGYRTVAGLCDRYWDTLYPAADDGDYEQRIGNLSWLLTHSVTWLKAIPLIQSAHGKFGQIHFDIARNRMNNPDDQASANDGLPPLDVLEAARRATSRDFYRELIEALPDCQEALRSLEAAVDARLGIDGPSFSSTREQLSYLNTLALRFARDAGLLLTEEDEAQLGEASVELTPLETPQSSPAQSNGALNSRREALAQLRRVADFFRRTEPHSPVAYLADKAARWGEMPLHVWLKRVIKDDATLAHMEELLDVGEPDQGN